MTELMLVYFYWLRCRPVDLQEVLRRRRRRLRLLVLIVVAVIAVALAVYGGYPIELTLLSIVGVVATAAVVSRYLQAGHTPTVGV
jgi:O-antigen/teichoic acid export membrane protein